MRLDFNPVFKHLALRFQRHRHSLKIVWLALALYQQGLSLRQVSVAMERFGHPVSHVTVWNWIQRCGELLDGHVWEGEMPKTIVVDETVIRTGWGKRWLYAAVDSSNRKLLFMRAYADRNMTTTLDFFSGLIEAYDGKRPRLVVVDGGPWYVWPLRVLNIKRNVMKGGIRSYVERFYRYLKQRLNGLDRFFPKGKGYKSIANWMRVFAWYYNHIRKGIPVN